MAKAMIVARSATSRCAALVMPSVSPMNTGARPGGSSVTSMVTKADLRKSSSIARRPPLPARERQRRAKP